MISIIAAVAENGVIGDKNALLWHITEDMRYFRRTTTGHPVVMGRRTFESLGRPLPARDNIVITRSNTSFEGCRTAHSLAEAVAPYPAEAEVFIIGGAQIYAEALPVADRLYLTRIERPYEGDTSFPEWSADEWRLVERQHFARGENFDYPFAFELYERIKG